MTKLLLFCPVWVLFFVGYLLIALIKLIIWLQCFHRQKTDCSIAMSMRLLFLVVLAYMVLSVALSHKYPHLHRLQFLILEISTLNESKLNLNRQSNVEDDCTPFRKDSF